MWLNGVQFKGFSNEEAKKKFQSVLDNLINTKPGDDPDPDDNLTLLINNMNN